MFKKILLVLVVVSVLLSLTVISVSATDSSLPLGSSYCPVDVNSSSVFDYTGDIYLFSRWSNYVDWQCNRIVCDGTRVYLYALIGDSLSRVEYNSDNHFLVVPVSFLDYGPFSVSNEIDQFLIQFPLTVSANEIFAFNSIGSYSISGYYSYIYIYEGNDIFNVVVDTRDISVSNGVMTVNPAGSPSTVVVTYDLNEQPYYFSSVDGITFNDINSSYINFYYGLRSEFTPIDPMPDDVDDIPVTVISFVQSIFDGLNNCFIFPGVSLMSVIWVFIGILLLRVFLNALAGG